MLRFSRSAPAAESLTAGKDHGTGLPRLILTLEPLVPLAVAPFLWFPGLASGLCLLLLPIPWLVRWATQGRLTVRTRYDAPLVCLLLVLPLALGRVVDWSLALPKLFSLLLGIAFLYALANALGTKPRLYSGAVLGVTFLGGGVAAVGLVGTEWISQKLLPFDPIYERLPRLVEGVVYGQPRGGIHPNEIGGILTLFVPPAISLVLSRRRWAAPSGPTLQPDLRSVGERLTDRLLELLQGPILIAASGIMAVVLVLTESRSAYAGTTVGVLLVLAWWLLVARGSPRARLIGGLGLATAVLAAGWLFGRLLASWPRTSGVGVESLPNRLELWSLSFTMLRDFPYTGVGPGQLSHVLHTSYTPVTISANTYVPHAHNFVLQLGLDFGIPGMVAVLFLLAGFFRNVWTGLRRAEDGQLQALAVGLGAGMISFLIYGLTDALALGARGALGLWLVLGLGAALTRVAQAESKVASPRSKVASPECPE